MKQESLIFLIALIIILISIIIPKTTWATFGEGTLIKGLSERVYVIENGLKRWIKTAEIFNELNYSWTNIKSVSEELLNNTPLGNNIDSSYKYPDGTLIKGIAPPVYLIEKGLKRWIPNPQIFEAKGFKWQNIIQTADRTVDRIETGTEISLDYNPSNHQPQTFILDGPCKQFQTTIPEIKTNKIEFKYSGSNSQGSATDLRFETFLDGYDDEWTGSWWYSSYEREITLPAENKTYTFYVRAKNQDNYYDTTPAFCKFKTNLSAYYEQIEISSVWKWGDDPNEERIVLRTEWSFSGSVNITGWTITTKKSRITIPQAVETIHPDSIYNFKKDIILRANEEISIYGGISPIGIDAYKSNICEEYYQPTAGHPQGDDNPSEYRTCFYEKNQYPDFLEEEWQVYLNRTSEFLVNEDEEIILKDKDGKVVDKYSY